MFMKGLIRDVLELKFKNYMNTLYNILKLSKDFIKIESISENPQALEKILDLALSNLKEFTIEKFSSNGIPSALIYNTDKRPEKFKVILNGHLDVIPGKKLQYKPKLINNKLYGVGSMDMKSNVVCLLLAFKEIAKKVNYPIALQIVTDEQCGSINGTKYHVDQGVNANFVIVGETTNFNIVNKSKGVIWLKVSTKGKSSHSAYPWNGNNSILKMHSLLDEIVSKYPLPHKEVWETTVSVSNIKTTNNMFNKIPDECEIWLDIRYISKDKNNILNSIKKLIPNDFDIDIVFDEPVCTIDNNNKYVKLLQQTGQNILKNEILLYGSHGTSDTTYYNRIGIPAVEFGPVGETGNTHDEYIDVKSLEKYYQILVTFLLNLN
jgi:succinyl-diaminopimelate desuccinylase